MVEIEHPTEQLKALVVVDFANVFPRYPLLLHLIGYQTAIAVFKGGFFDGVRAKQTHERNHVLDGEVLHFGRVVEREDGVALG